MNILFISKDLGQVNLVTKLAREGNDVKVFVMDEYWRVNQKRPGLKFTNNWRNELNWVEKKGLIVFEYTGMGRIQNELRKQGFSVFGGSELGDRLENNRQYGQKIFSLVGMNIKQSKDFYSLKEAIEFIKKNPRKWVVKQNGQMDKGLNYVGSLNDGSDVLSILKNYRRILKNGSFHFDLQEKIDGIEIAVGRFFNGCDWVGPICLNIEHKNLFNSELGPKTHEMGNLMWYEKDEKNKLFMETLAKMKYYLNSIDYRGYFDINCIVNEKGAYPLEATARLGQPTVEIQDTIHVSDWGKLLKAIADGQNFNLEFRKGYAIIVFLGTPPYPYENRSNFNSPRGLEIFFKEKISKKEMKNLYFEEVSLHEKAKKEKHIICGKSGYIAHVSGFGKNVNKAREEAYKIINKLVIPKMFYRTDIGLKFIQEDRKKLKKWGWI